MKKFLSVVMVAVLVLSLSVAAFAADSVKEVAGGVAVPTEIDGKTSTVTEEKATVVSEATVNTSIDKVIADAGKDSERGKAFYAKAPVVIAAFDLTLDGYVEGTKVTFDVTVPESGTYMVLHKGADGWEVVFADKTAGTTIQVTSSLSPFAVVKLNERQAASSGSSSSASASTGATSPNTGVDSVIVYAMIAILMSGAVVFATRKKEA